MLATKQQKTQFIYVQCWILILVLKFFIIFVCLFVLFYKIMFLHYSLTDASGTSFGETEAMEGSKVVYMYVPLQVTL